MLKRLVFLICALSASNVLADFESWQMATKTIGKKKVCYIYSFPEKSDYAKRDQPYIMVTATSKTSTEFSLSAGYPFKENKVEVTINDSNTYSLFTRGSVAWLKTKQEDKDIVEKMKKNDSLVVESTSKWGNDFREIYTLNGFSKKYSEMLKTCFK